MASIFTKIIDREIPAYIIQEDKAHLAFLDAKPLVEGHTLVIPKQEEDFIFDLDSDEHQALWKFAQQVAKKLKKTYPGKRIAVAVIGLEVPHAHIHLMPVTSSSEVNFDVPRKEFTQEQFAEIAKKIAQQ